MLWSFRRWTRLCVCRMGLRVETSVKQHFDVTYCRVRRTFRTLHKGHGVYKLEWSVETRRKNYGCLDTNGTCMLSYLVVARLSIEIFRCTSLRKTRDSIMMTSCRSWTKRTTQPIKRKSRTWVRSNILIILIHTLDSHYLLRLSRS